MNKVVLLGYLARDPESRINQNGVTLTKFILALNRPKDQNGEERGADFIHCIAWKKLAENVAKYCFKGSRVAVEGRIQVSSYDGQDGQRYYSTDVVATNVIFLGNKQQSGQETGQQMPIPEAPIPSTEDPFKDFGEEITLSDDGLELPF